MSASDKVFAGCVPEFYDAFMVPLIFQVYADDLAARVSEIRPSSVLETAAGTGVVTRALAGRLARGARYAASDLNQAMMDHAAARQPEDPAVEWRQADALDLPFADGEFDVVICQFGAMFFPDRPKGHAESRRVLRPGGRYVFSVWDRIENNELAHIVTETVAAVCPEDPPRFLARTPHGYFDRDLIRADLESAGFSEIVIDHLEATSLAPSAAMAATAYCQGTPLRNEIETRGPSMLEEVTGKIAAAIEARFGKGPIASRISANVVTAAG